MRICASVWREAADVYTTSHPRHSLIRHYQDMFEPEDTMIGLLYQTPQLRTLLPPD